LAEWFGGGNPKGKVGFQELKVNILSGYGQCERDLVLTGLTRLLQIETDFMNGRAISLHYYY